MAGYTSPKARVSRRSTGITADPPLRQVAKDLRAIGPTYEKRLGQINKRAGNVVVEEAKRRTGELPSRFSKAASTFTASATQAYVRVAVRNLARIPYALAAVLGTYHDVERVAFRKGTGYQLRGWNQFPDWVGNQWKVGDRSGGPRALNPAIAAKVDDLLGLHADALAELWQEIGNEIRG